MIRSRLLTTGICGGGEEPFYASISIVIPDLNSTVKCSAKTVIFSMSFLTRVSSNSEMLNFCLVMKPCSSLIRFMVSSRWWRFHQPSDSSLLNILRKLIQKIFRNDHFIEVFYNVFIAHNVNPYILRFVYFQHPSFGSHLVIGALV